MITDFLVQIEDARRANAKQADVMPTVGAREIEAAVLAHYERMAVGISESGSSNRHEKISALDLVIENQLSVNALKVWSAVAQDATRLCKEHG